MANFISTPNLRLLAALSLLVSCASSSSTDDFVKGMKDANQPPVFVLKLERQSVVLPKEAVHAGRRKNFYSAKISVGQPPQEFHVSFDLGGGTVVLPSKDCTDPACLERRLYNRWTSEIAEDIQANGQLVHPNARNERKTRFLGRAQHGSLAFRDVDLGTGKVSGTFVRDEVCVYDANDELKQNPLCFELALLAATKMSDMPLHIEPYDGMVGLGLKSMSVSPEFNFMASFLKGDDDGTFDRERRTNSFGLHIGPDGGEMTLGGYDASRLTHPLKWTPVADADEGRWQVAISAIRIGNNTIEACRNRACRAAIDYSSSLLGVPSTLAGSLESVLSKMGTPLSGVGDGCQQLAIPDLHLELDNDVTLTLPAEDFVSDIGQPVSQAEASSCDAHLTRVIDDSLLSAARDTFVLGEATLRRYYTFFNADTMSVGFSLAAGAQSKLGLPGKKGKKALDGENPVILLVQVKLTRKKTVSSLGM